MAPAALLNYSLKQMTSSHMSWFYFTQHRLFLTAAVGSIWASVAEITALWKVYRAWDLSLCINSLNQRLFAYSRNCCKQHLGIRMYRIGEKGVFISHFHNTSQIHNAQSVTDVAYN